jgi:Skp family chaperone for outer membrane proteins
MRLMNFACAAAIAVVALSASPAAFAQRNRGGGSTTVVVVNFQRVVSESALGRDLTTKLQAIRGQISQEAQALAPEQQSIQQEQQRLATASRNMTADQVRASPTLAPQFQAFQQRVQQFQARSQALEGDYECTQLIAFRDYDHTLSPIVRTIMLAQGAGAVLNSTNVQQVEPQFDVTNTVIQQLDAASRTATVARHAVSECASQQPAAGATPPAN